jgi:hypothetical protein
LIIYFLVKDDEDEQNDEGILENESEMILDYIEKFNDLFDHSNYIEAAYFAAAGPNNLLRNMEIMLKFKSTSLYFKFILNKN